MEYNCDICFKECNCYGLLFFNSIFKCSMCKKKTCWDCTNWTRYEDSICEHCSYDLYKCDHCKNFIENNDDALTTIDDQIICFQCVEPNGYLKCEKCDKVIDDDRAYNYDDDGCVDDDKLTCKHCRYMEKLNAMLVLERIRKLPPDINRYIVSILN